jgi:hypothetical protein
MFSNDSRENPSWSGYRLDGLLADRAALQIEADGIEALAERLAAIPGQQDVADDLEYAVNRIGGLRDQIARIEIEAEEIDPGIRWDEARPSRIEWRAAA